MSCENIYDLTCRVTGVIKRWILGAFVRCLDFPSFSGIGLLITNWRTSSSFVRLNSLRIFEALFGPNLRGMVSSVSPGISYKAQARLLNIWEPYIINVQTAQCVFNKMCVDTLVTRCNKLILSKYPDNIKSLYIYFSFYLLNYNYIIHLYLLH